MCTSVVLPNDDSFSAESHIVHLQFRCHCRLLRDHTGGNTYKYIHTQWRMCVHGNELVGGKSNAFCSIHNYLSLKIHFHFGTHTLDCRTATFVSLVETNATLAVCVFNISVGQQECVESGAVSVFSQITQMLRFYNVHYTHPHIVCTAHGGSSTIYFEQCKLEFVEIAHCKVFPHLVKGTHIRALLYRIDWCTRAHTTRKPIPNARCMSIMDRTADAFVNA